MVVVFPSTRRWLRKPLGVYMAQFKRINILQINNHLWVFTDPQIIEWDRGENSTTMKAMLRIHHEEHLTKRATDASPESSLKNKCQVAKRR